MGKESDVFKLIATIDTLLGPQGCPWDQALTLADLKKSVLEEAYEVVDAISDGGDQEICEEIGDLLVNVVLLAKISEKEGLFHWIKPFLEANEKLIRRHPHVFDGCAAACSTKEEVVAQWEKLKAEEQQKKQQHPLIDGIGASMPAIHRLQKLYKRIRKYPDAFAKYQEWAAGCSDELARKMLGMIEMAYDREECLEEKARKMFDDLVKVVSG